MKKKEKIANQLRVDRIIIRGGRLLAFAGQLKAEIKIMERQILNMKSIARQAEEFSAESELLGQEDEPVLSWIINH